MTRAFKSAILVWALGTLFICFTVSSAGAVSLKAAAGGSGGGWYQAFSQIAQLVKEKDSSIDIKVVPGGGLANPPRVNSGEVQMGFAFPPFVNAASKGKKPYKKAHSNIRTIAGGFGLNPLQFIITQDTGITSIDQLVQKKFPLKFAADRVGTTDEWSCKQVFKFYDVSYADVKKWGGKVMHLGYGDIETQIKDRNADATFIMIAPPASIITSVAISRPIRVLEFSDSLKDHLVNDWSFSPAIIKAGTYKGQDSDVQTVALFTVIMASKNAPDDVVYKITKIILENPERVRKISPAFKNFDPTKAGIGTGGELHPGAMKFYKEKGWIK